MQSSSNVENFDVNLVGDSNRSNQMTDQMTAVSETKSSNATKPNSAAKVKKKTTNADMRCHYFVRGKTCARGDSCPFLHSWEESAIPDASIDKIGGKIEKKPQLNRSKNDAVLDNMECGVVSKHIIFPENVMSNKVVAKKELEKDHRKAIIDGAIAIALNDSDRKVGEKRTKKIAADDRKKDVVAESKLNINPSLIHEAVKTVVEPTAKVSSGSVSGKDTIKDVVVSKEKSFVAPKLSKTKKDKGSGNVKNSMNSCNNSSHSGERVEEVSVNSVPSVQGYSGEAILGPVQDKGEWPAASQVLEVDNSSFMQSLIQASEAERENIDEGKRLLKALKLKQIGVHTVGQGKHVRDAAAPSLFTSNEPFLSLSRPRSVSNEISPTSVVTCASSSSIAGMAEELTLAAKSPVQIDFAAPVATFSTKSSNDNGDGSCDSVNVNTVQTPIIAATTGFKVEVAGVPSKASKRAKIKLKKAIAALEIGVASDIADSAAAEQKEVESADPKAGLAVTEDPFSTALSISTTATPVDTLIPTESENSAGDVAVDNDVVEIVGGKSKRKNRSKRMKDKRKALAKEMELLQCAEGAAEQNSPSLVVDVAAANEATEMEREVVEKDEGNTVDVNEATEIDCVVVETETNAGNVFCLSVVESANINHMIAPSTPESRSERTDHETAPLSTVSSKCSLHKDNSVANTDEESKFSVENSPASACAQAADGVEEQVSSGRETPGGVFDGSTPSNATAVDAPPSLFFPPNPHPHYMLGQQVHQQPLPPEHGDYHSGPPLPYGMAHPYFHPPHGLPPMSMEGIGMEGYQPSHCPGYPPMPLAGYPPMPYYPPTSGPPLQFPTGLAEYHIDGSGMGSFPMGPPTHAPMPPHMMHPHPSQYPPSQFSPHPPMYSNPHLAGPYDPFCFPPQHQHGGFDGRHDNRRHWNDREPTYQSHRESSYHAYPSRTSTRIPENRMRRDSQDTRKSTPMSSPGTTSINKPLSRNSSFTKVPLEAEGKAVNVPTKTSPVVTPSIVVIDGVALTSLPMKDIAATKSPLSPSRSSAAFLLNPLPTRSPKIRSVDSTHEYPEQASNDSGGSNGATCVRKTSSTVTGPPGFLSTIDDQCDGQDSGKESPTEVPRFSSGEQNSNEFTSLDKKEGKIDNLLWSGSDPINQKVAKGKKHMHWRHSKPVVKLNTN